MRFPPPGTPNNFISPWWDDFEGHPGGQVRHHNPTPSEIVIEYSNWGRAALPAARRPSASRCSSDASGMFQVHYGTKTGPAFSDVDHNGFENSDGTQGGTFLLAAAPLVAARIPLAGEHAVHRRRDADRRHLRRTGQTSNRVKNGSNLTFTVQSDVQELRTDGGEQLPLEGVSLHGPSLDAQDRLVFTSTSAVSLAARGTATATGNVSVTNRRPGSTTS